MQPDPSGNANAKAKLPQPMTASTPSLGQPASMLPYKMMNVHDFYCINKNLG
jgi:calcium-dependent protein kinase